jgi:hypothetical protein
METASQSSFHSEATNVSRRCRTPLMSKMKRTSLARSADARIDAPCCDNSSMTIKRQPISVS